MFFKQATKIDEIFTVDLTLCSKCQIDGEDFVKFCGLLIKHEIYVKMLTKYPYRIQNSRSKSKDGLFDSKSEWGQIVLFMEWQISNSNPTWNLKKTALHIRYLFSVRNDVVNLLNQNSAVQQCETL